MLLTPPQVNPHPTPMAMASSPLPPLLLLLLLFPLLALLALAAAQGDEPFPPSQQQQQQLYPTNASDAAALHAVFQHWGLEDGAAAADNPCGKRVWFESFATNASINCSCSGSTGECRITHLNVTGYWNITEIPRVLFNLRELVSLDLSNNNLSGSIPPEVANLSKLEAWRIYGMKLRGPIPIKFSSLINLKNLMLGDLDGGNSSFDFIADWANLSTLSLRKCGIIGQLPRTPPKLPNLKYLDLRSNNLSGPIQLLLLYKNVSYIYVGENNFSGSLPSKIVQPSLALDVSNNPFLNGSLPNNVPDQKWSINYIGTLIDAINSENLTPLNCLHMKECNRKYYSNPMTSFAVNCGGKQKNYSDPLTTVFDDDLNDLGAAGFHVNTDSRWVVSHVGSDPFNVTTSGIVHTSQAILGTDMPDLYKTARTSTSALWYYVVGLSNGKYTVQLFFAEIVIESQLIFGPGRRLFNIAIQDQNIRTDFDIIKEAGGSRRPTNITHEVTVDNSILEIHLYWNGRGTCCIPYEGAYGPLVSAIRVFRPQNSSNSPPPVTHSALRDEKRRGVIAGIAALGIAATVISSSVVYLWWKWISLVKYPKI